MNYIIGLDAGTTCFKAGLYDETMKPITVVFENYQLNYTAEGFIEFEPEEYWQITCRLIRRMLSESGISAADVCGIGISSQGETLLFLDKDGKPTRPAIIWTDARAVNEKEALQAEYTDETVFAVTGQREISAGWPAAKWMWVKKHQPEVASATAHLLLLGDYLSYRLTGRYATTRCLSTSTLYMDIHTGDWWPEMLRSLSLPREILPELLDSTDTVGHLTEQAASETGLTEAVSVAGGAFDQACGMVGSGNLQPGTISETTGTCLAVCAGLGGLIPPYGQGHLPIHYGIEAGSYYTIYWSGAAGSILRWVRESFYSEDTSNEIYKKMDADAALVPAGSEGLTILPYFSGVNFPFTVENATGTAAGLTLFHRRRHFSRAALESVAYLLRQSLEELKGYGLTVDVIRSLGGGAVSPVWCRMKADATGCTVTVSDRKEETCFGAAVLAAVSVGLFSDCRQALDATKAAEKNYSPENPAVYTALYERFCRLAEQYFEQIRREEKGS